MKKTVILILAILPIVLLIVIAFAGRILKEFQYIAVDRAEFIDHLGTAYSEDVFFEVGEGETLASALKIYPSYATNKKVTYTSADTNICTVDGEGNITGVNYGTTTVTAKTDDSSRVALLSVKVTADIPKSVTLSKEELTLVPEELHTLTASVDALVAKNKRVEYTSSNEAVAIVDEQGIVTAVAPGEAVITVTTLVGGRTDTCKVTVTEGDLPIRLDLSNVDGVVRSNNVYVSSIGEIDISQNLVVKEGLDRTKMVIKIQSGSDYAVLEDGILKLNTEKSGRVVLVIYIGDENNPDAYYEVRFRYGTVEAENP